MKNTGLGLTLFIIAATFSLTAHSNPLDGFTLFTGAGYNTNTDSETGNQTKMFSTSASLGFNKWLLCKNDDECRILISMDISASYYGDNDVKQLYSIHAGFGVSRDWGHLSILGGVGYSLHSGFQGLVGVDFSLFNVFNCRLLANSEIAIVTFGVDILTAKRLKRSAKKALQHSKNP